METQIQIFSNDDLKKSGGFKKKNSVITMEKLDFFKYLKANDLNISSDYFDRTGKITDGLRFSCSHSNLIIGTSSIVKEFQK